MKPIQLKRMKRTNFYTPVRRVWFQKNDDSRPVATYSEEVDKNLEGKQIRKFVVHSKGLADTDFQYDYEESARQQVKNLNRKNSKDVSRRWRN